MTNLRINIVLLLLLHFFTGCLASSLMKKNETMTRQEHEAISKLENVLDIKLSFDESEISAVDKLLVDKISKGAISRQAINEELYISIIVFISQVYRRNYGGKLINLEKNELNPTHFKCSNGKMSSSYLALYMDLQQSSSFLQQEGYIEFIYSELVTDCEDAVTRKH